METVVRLVGQEGVRLSVDQRTNSILAIGSPDEVNTLEAVLLRLDEEKKDKDDAELRVIHLRSNVNSVQASLKGVIPREVRMVADVQTNSLIVSGTASQIQKVMTLVETLDVPPKAQAATKQYKLRVVWLLSGGEGNVPTKDLKPVLDSLGKIGIGDLKMVTQSLVNIAGPGSSFDVLGTTDEHGQSLEISGKRSRDQPESGPMKIELSVRAAPIGQKEPVAVEAAISLSPGQTAVLGVTQTGKGNSAFIVQLVEGL